MSGMSVHATDQDGEPQRMGTYATVYYFGRCSYWKAVEPGAIKRPIRVPADNVLSIQQARALLNDLAGAVLAAEDDLAGRLAP